MRPKVRQAWQADAAALADVYARAYPQQPRHPEPFDFAAHTYLLAFVGDRPVG